MKKLYVKLEVQVPQIPNFLRTDYGTVPLSAITEGGLREIGAAWTEDLVKRAEEQCKQKK